MRLRAAAAVLTVALCAGCGEDDASDALSETAGNLSELRSGRLDSRLAIRAEGVQGGNVGFRIAGRFALARRRGELPAARMEYTQIAGPRRATLDFLSTRSAAFAQVGGAWYRLPDERARGLRALGPAGGDSDELPIDDWIRDPALERRGALDRISGDLIVGEAVSGLLAVARRLGGDSGLPALGEEGRRRLDEAARVARVEVVTGHEDRLLRRLRLHVSLRTRAAGVGSLGRLRGASIDFVLAVRRPNRPVRVTAPGNVRDYTGLTGGR